MGAFDPDAERDGDLLAPPLQVRLDELLVLQQLYEATGGARWARRRGWRVYAPAGDPCGSPSGWFEGVGCANPCDPGPDGVDCRRARLTRIELPNNGLSGTLPSSLGALRQLTWLDLSGNSLSGTLPTELGRLGRLGRLRLHGNSISGTLPTELGEVGAGSTLTTRFDALAGAITRVGTPRSGPHGLTELLLSANRFSGTLPTELGALSRLEYLELSDNRMLGTPLGAIMHSAPYNGTHTHGQSLPVGPPATAAAAAPPSWPLAEAPVSPPMAPPAVPAGLPSELCNLSHLVLLDVSRSGLGGSLPSSVGCLGSLEFLYATDAQLSGTLPAELGALSSLRDLRLDYNPALSGTLPTSLSGLGALRAASFEGDARLSGTLPDVFDSMPQLRFWSTFGCGLATSAVPPSIKALGARLISWEFYVQDEQLELLADFRCGRERFIWQHKMGRRINYVPTLARRYDDYVASYCHERYKPLEQRLMTDFGPGERYPNGFLKPGQRVYIGYESERFKQSKPVSGLKFRKDDAWKLTGAVEAFRWDEEAADENGKYVPDTVGIPFPKPPPGNRRFWKESLHPDFHHRFATS